MFLGFSDLFLLRLGVFAKVVFVVVGVVFDRFTSFESSCINCDWPLFTVTHNRLCNKRKILNKSAKEWMKDNIAKRQIANQTNGQYEWFFGLKISKLLCRHVVQYNRMLLLCYCWCVINSWYFWAENGQENWLNLQKNVNNNKMSSNLWSIISDAMHIQNEHQINRCCPFYAKYLFL